MMKIFLTVFFFLLNVSLWAQKDYTQLVNPFIGTGGHGHTYPGASMPFGMMQLSPDTRPANWDGSSGYHFSDSVIYGFSHTHLSGTGIPDYCDLLVMPFTGKVEWEPERFKSPFLHHNEKASPGYYEVMLDKHQIMARLTASFRSGMHLYEFPSGTKEGAVLIDLTWRDEVLESSLEMVSDHAIRGMRRSKSWAQDQHFYFYMEFDQPVKELLLLQNNIESRGNKNKAISGKSIRASLKFNMPASRNLKVRTGISAVSMEGAKLNLQKEISHWSFDQLRRESKRSWNRELGKIHVEGGSHDQQVSFYTALYHTFLAPNIFHDVDGKYRSTDGKIHFDKGFTNYTVFSLWDTYRAYHPLMTILNRERTKDWIQTFLKQYQHGGMLPVWELAGNETFCMIGYHSVPVIVDAYQKGIRDFDQHLALKAMLSYAESDRFGLRQYRENGFISNKEEHESVSKTLEYAYDDWCIAQYARMLGKDSVYQAYISRAQHYKNLFDPQTRHMRGRVDAMWHHPFDAAEINNFFTEGNSWQYSFAVPQDINGMIALYGGNENFSSKVEELFTTSSTTTGRAQPDVTGLIGQYAQGNEPSHHMAYLFNYVGKPWKTQELIHKICREFYTNTPDGLIGNEDCGQMSAWYIFSAMGFYPVCPGNGQYVIGTPLFDKVTIHLENGKTFQISSVKNQKDAFYVQGSFLNGEKYERSFLLHEDIMSGGHIQFILDQQPGKDWGTDPAELPASAINEEFLAVPYFTIQGNKFRDSIRVELKTIDPEAAIWKHVSDGEYYLSFEPLAYHPIVLDTGKYVFAYAEKNGRRSRIIAQPFYKMPSDKSIKIESKVHPMYTAGGPDALIDGIKGNTNWRAGEWQSYFDQDFEALIDLKSVREIQYAGIHVLQDVSPWIVYPKEVIFYGSKDGLNFTEIGRATHQASSPSNEVSMKEMGAWLKENIRYLKVVAINGGKLPEWHESAGEGSHLFISEIVIK